MEFFVKHYVLLRKTAENLMHVKLQWTMEVFLQGMIRITKLNYIRIVMQARKDIFNQLDKLNENN